MADELFGNVLEVEDRDAVRILRMNRPDKLNALDTALTQALHQALVTADAAPSVRAVVLAGAGRAFCAGADVSEFKDLTGAHAHRVEARSVLTMQLHMQLQRCRKPIVSAVQGNALGGGAGLALGCDMMVAGTDVRFGYPEIRHSIVPAIVMTGLQRQIGRKLAFELVSTGRLLDGDALRELGLANRVVAPVDVLDAALTIAASWSAAHPAAMAAIKQLFYAVADLPFAGAMEEGRRVNMAMRSFGTPVYEAAPRHHGP